MDPDNRIAKMMVLSQALLDVPSPARTKKRVGITTHGRAQSRKSKQMRKRMRK